MPVITRVVIGILIISLAVSAGCSGKTAGQANSDQGSRQEQSKLDRGQKSPSNSADRTPTEDETYRAIKESAKKYNLPVYKPSYTAGFTFSPVDPWGKPYPVNGDTVWYRKGSLYFRVINNLSGDTGGVRTQSIGQVNGHPAVMTINGMIAKWDEIHKVNGSERTLSYGVEIFRAGAVPKMELVKIIKSMKPIQ